MAASEPFVVVLTGPTAVGKSELAVRIAGRCGAHIISADSRQLYRKMDIGTAKPTPEMLRAVPHHFVDHLDPDADFSAGEFAREARKVIGDLWEKGIPALVVGGSGFYLEALLHPLYSGREVSPEIRREIRARYETLSPPELHGELQRLDPETAARIAPRDRKRLLRYLEIAHLENEAPSRVFARSTPGVNLRYRLLVLNLPREELYARINRRVEKMFNAGLTGEVKALLKAGLDPRANALNSVGYREMLPYLAGEVPLEETLDLIKRNTRRFAKRQLTWFRRWPEARWVDREQAEKLSGEVARWFREAGLKAVTEGGGNV